MNPANENPPEGNNRGANAVAIDAIESSPMLAGSPDKLDTSESDFIATNPRAHAIYTQGWEGGHAQGVQDGHRDAGNAADLTARAYYAMEANEAHTRAFAQSAADAFNVPRMAARPTLKATLHPIPTLGQFLDGLRRGGVLTEAVAA